MDEEPYEIWSIVWMVAGAEQRALPSICSKCLRLHHQMVQTLRQGTRGGPCFSIGKGLQ
jgi:hypothetical protein